MYKPDKVPTGCKETGKRHQKYAHEQTKTQMSQVCIQDELVPVTPRGKELVSATDITAVILRLKLLLALGPYPGTLSCRADMSQCLVPNA